jgi:hypothetical protein
VDDETEWKKRLPKKKKKARHGLIPALGRQRQVDF